MLYISTLDSRILNSGEAEAYCYRRWNLCVALHRCAPLSGHTARMLLTSTAHMGATETASTD